MTDRVCKSCGYIGKAEHQSWGTFIVDAFIWLMFGSLTLFSGLLFVLVIPLAWSIYHIALFGNTQCPKCESLDMVPMDSARALLAANRMIVRSTPIRSATMHN